VDKRVGTVAGIVLILVAVLATPLGPGGGVVFDLSHAAVVAVGVVVAVAAVYLVQSLRYAS
jgi:hypothetical protein